MKRGSEAIGRGLTNAVKHPELQWDNPGLESALARAKFLRRNEHELIPAGTYL